MTKKDQRRIILEMCRSQRKAMLERLPRIPEQWDGHELRALFQDVATYGYGHSTMDGKRRKDYRNTCYIANL